MNGDQKLNDAEYKNPLFIISDILGNNGGFTTQRSLLSITIIIFIFGVWMIIIVTVHVL